MKLSYDELSPITGNKCVISEPNSNGIEMKLCMESGYHTHSNWKADSPERELFETSCPELVKDSALFDEQTGFVWYKITMMTQTVWLYPDVEDGVSFWKVSTFKEIKSEDEQSFVALKVGDKLFGIDPDSTQTFAENQFQDAVDYFYKVNNQNQN